MCYLWRSTFTIIMCILGNKMSADDRYHGFHVCARGSTFLPSFVISFLLLFSHSFLPSFLLSNSLIPFFFIFVSFFLSFLLPFFLFWLVARSNAGILGAMVWRASVASLFRWLPSGPSLHGSLPHTNMSRFRVKFPRLGARDEPSVLFTVIFTHL